MHLQLKINPGTCQKLEFQNNLMQKRKKKHVSYEKSLGSCTTWLNFPIKMWHSENSALRGGIWADDNGFHLLIYPWLIESFYLLNEIIIFFFGY